MIPIAYNNKTVIVSVSLVLSLVYLLTRSEREVQKSGAFVTTVEGLCEPGRESNCAAPLRSVTSKYRLAPKRNLAACLIEKSMSTVLAAIICYIHNPKAYEKANRTFSEDVYGIRFCKNKNEETTIKNTLRRLHAKPRLLTVVRDPVERFLSGFTEKCAVKKSSNSSQCYGCRGNMKCFLETFLNRTRLKHGRDESNVDLYDVHFSPQSWYCSLNQYWNNYTIIKYGSEGEEAERMRRQLFEVFRETGVEEHEVGFIERNMRGKTGHSTQHRPERQKNRLELMQNSVNMRLFLQLYYYDFSLFGFKMPQLQNF